MATHDYAIADQSGLSFLSDLNNVLAAIVSNNSSATEPADTYPYMWWVDTTSNILKQRNATDDGWIEKISLAGTALETANNLSDLASAATARTNLGLSTGATSTVTTSATDTTAGRLLKVGDFGLGSSAPVNVPNDDLDDALVSGFYTVEDFTANKPTTSGGTLTVSSRNVNMRFQLYQEASSPYRTYTRVQSGGTWYSWRKVYQSDSILGTVSQSAGVPTGAIIERGSNSNGEYVRYADGTLICTDIDRATSTGTSWTYPSAFTAEPSISSSANSTLSRFVSVSSIGTTSATFYGWQDSGASSGTTTNPIAVGRWF